MELARTKDGVIVAPEIIDPSYNDFGPRSCLCSSILTSVAAFSSDMALCGHPEKMRQRVEVPDVVLPKEHENAKIVLSII